jgi:ABC-type nitrate/sulfonate/bicarbonate transport system permease component
MFAAIAVLSMMALILFGLVALLERLVVTWNPAAEERRT